MTAIDTHLEILVLLDSPLLPGLAPELVPLRDRVAAEIAKLEAARCTNCAKKSIHRNLRRIAEEMGAMIRKSPDLQRVVDALQISSAQAKQEPTHV
jgi:hypothetical protein